MTTDVHIVGCTYLEFSDESFPQQNKSASPEFVADEVSTADFETYVKILVQIFSLKDAFC
jgi:hypothetical protein